MRYNRVVLTIVLLLLFTPVSKGALLLNVFNKMRYLKINNAETTCLTNKSYFPIYEINDDIKNDDITTALSYYLASVDRRQYKKWKSKCNRTGRIVPLPYDDRVVKMWAAAELEKISPSESVPTKEQSAPSVPKERCLAAIKADKEFQNGNFSSAASYYKKSYELTRSVVDLLNKGISEYNARLYKRAYHTMTSCLDNPSGLTKEMKQTAREIRDKAYNAWNSNRQEASNAISGILQSALGSAFGYGYRVMNTMAPPNPYTYINSSGYYSNPGSIFIQNGVPTPEEYMNGARFNNQVPSSIAGTPQGVSMATTLRNNEIRRQNLEQFWSACENNNKELEKLVARNYSEWSKNFALINGREPNANEIQMFYQNAYNPSIGSNMTSSQGSVESNTNMNRTPSGDYQIDYDYYAGIAELYYNSATLGDNHVNSSGDYDNSTSNAFNGTSLGSSTATTFKAKFHIAQNHMRHIRNEAALKGITIKQSRWETAILN